MSLREEKFVYFNSVEIVKTDIIWGLIEIGIDVEISKISVNIQEYEEEEVLKIGTELVNYGCAITQNFCAPVAEACHRKNIPYISWVYDSPQRALFLKEALYDTNFIFMFDRNGIARIKDYGIKHLYYLPLAANMAQTSMLDITDEDINKYGSDISFVGSMYDRSYMNEMLDTMPENIKMDFESWIQNNETKWEKGHRIFNDFPKTVIDYVSRVMNRTGLENYNISEDYIIEILAGAYYLTSRERRAVLNAASEKYGTRLYTKQQTVSDINVEICPPVNYEDEMYKVFYSSKINLNITYRGIETGVPQRIFDIMSVGGFVLTNYQEEIEELFEIGKDLEVFYNLEDFKNKITHYMEHEEERIRIGINGYQKVRDVYNYTNSLNIIIDTVERDMVNK